MRGFEPGDADWGVRLDDVRGQDEAKAEVGRVVSLWQSGEAFEEAGGKRERGLLFLGAPGTGKTMLAKAIATGFNCPFVIDARLRLPADVHGHGRGHRPLAGAEGEEARSQVGRPVHRLHRRDRRRRHAPLGARRRRRGGNPLRQRRSRTSSSSGPHGALNPSGDMILETRAWRDRLFAERDGEPAAEAGPPRRDRQPGRCVPGE